MRIATTVSAVLLWAAPVFTHVGVTPGESQPGATETYTLRVPSEGGRTTTSVTLEVPEGVTVRSVSAPDGAKHEENREGDRILSITWTIEIAPGASAQLAFVARNPPQGEAIAWRVHQHYSDGTVSDWVDPAGSRSPAPVTRLVATHAH